MLFRNEYDQLRLNLRFWGLLCLRCLLPLWQAASANAEGAGIAAAAVAAAAGAPVPVCATRKRID